MHLYLYCTGRVSQQYFHYGVWQQIASLVAQDICTIYNVFIHSQWLVTYFHHHTLLWHTEICPSIINQTSRENPPRHYFKPQRIILPCFWLLCPFVSPLLQYPSGCQRQTVHLASTPICLNDQKSKITGGTKELKHQDHVHPSVSWYPAHFLKRERHNPTSTNWID